MVESAKVDVLIPAYNAERTMESALASIQNQTLGDLRIIVVNDGSTDMTGAILHGMARADPRILVIDMKNGGVVAALNAAIEHVRAPFVARHDADDIAFPDRFERQLAYLDQNPECVAVAANAWHIDATGRRTGRTHMPAEPEGNAYAIPSKEPYLMHPFLMMRRDALFNAGGYRYVLHAEDTDLYWRLLSQGRLRNLPDILGEYRIHQGSVSSRSVHNGRVAAVYSQIAAISFLRRQNGRPDLTFSSNDLKATRSLDSVDSILNFVSPRLDEAEFDYLKAATAAKMLELASYRPYQLERKDCLFIRKAGADFRSRLSGNDRGMLRWNSADVFTRLVTAGRWREALALRPRWDVYAVMLKRAVQKAISRNSMSKVDGQRA